MIQSEWTFNRADGCLLPTPVHPLETDSHSPHRRTGLGTPGPLALNQESDQDDFKMETDFRHSGWAGNRERVRSSLWRIEPSFTRISNFASCGTNAWVERCVQDPDRFRIRSDRCHDRFCLPCGQERSRVIAHNVRERLDPKIARMITLTVRSLAEPLTDLLDKLYKGFAKLRRSRLWLGTQLGGVAFLEVKWSVERQRWHPHLHVLAEGKYIAKPALSASWLKATRDSFIVDVGKIKSIESVVSYVVKYASKPMDASLFQDWNRLDEAILALKGRRLALTFGSWRGIKLMEVPGDDEWEVVCSLVAFIGRARKGDAQAAKVLRRSPLHEFPSECRAPPVDWNPDYLEFSDD